MTFVLLFVVLKWQNGHCCQPLCLKPIGAFPSSHQYANPVTQNESRLQNLYTWIQQNKGAK